MTVGDTWTDVWCATADDMVRINLADPDTWPKGFDVDALRVEAGKADDQHLIAILDRVGL